MIRLDPTAPGQLGRGSADAATWYNKPMVVQATQTEE
jgi:hypothetical protein